MPRFSITHQGVPIGTVELEPNVDVAVGAVDPTPGYEAIRALARTTGEALNASGFFGSRPASTQPDPAASEALRRGAALGKVLELRDASGAFVATTFIEIAEWPGVEPEVIAWIGFRAAPASVPARELPGGKSGSGTAQ